MDTAQCHAVGSLGMGLDCAKDSDHAGDEHQTEEAEFDQAGAGAKAGVDEHQRCNCDFTQLGTDVWLVWRGRGDTRSGNNVHGDGPPG